MNKDTMDLQWAESVCVFEGFKVAVISRDNSRLEKLRSFISPTTKDNLTTIVGDVGELGSFHSSIH